MHFRHMDHPPEEETAGCVVWRTVGEIVLPDTIEKIGRYAFIIIEI